MTQLFQRSLPVDPNYRQPPTRVPILCEEENFGLDISISKIWSIFYFWGADDNWKNTLNLSSGIISNRPQKSLEYKFIINNFINISYSLIITLTKHNRIWVRNLYILTTYGFFNTGAFTNIVLDDLKWLSSF